MVGVALDPFILSTAHAHTPILVPAGPTALPEGGPPLHIAAKMAFGVAAKRVEISEAAHVSALGEKRVIEPGLGGAGRLLSFVSAQGRLDEAAGQQDLRCFCGTEAFLNQNCLDSEHFFFEMLRVELRKEQMI